MLLLKKLKAVSSHCFLLESVAGHDNWGRYTFLGFDPRIELVCKNGESTITQGGEVRNSKENPNDLIRNVLAKYKTEKQNHLPPFTGGFVGYFGYEFAKYTEPVLESCLSSDTSHFNDVDIMLFDKVFAFDNYKQKLVLMVNVFEGDNEKKMQAQLQRMEDIVLHGTAENTPPCELLSDFRPHLDKEQFCKMVEKCKEHIKEGDIFQAVLSNRLEADFKGSILDMYRNLRTLNPSSYMFYFSGSDLEIAGASPETLVKLENGKLYTFPLAGSRPRGKDEAEDLALQQELLADEKELSEHNMLVDLGRNDLGRISKFGTVKVEKYMEILKLSHIMHIGSTVSGEIREKLDGLDAINAVLPAGTLSGAPKIRAMQIISDLEQSQRGIYGGAIGYLDFTGNMDTCISIRLAYKKNGKVFVRSGAGIVADSVPDKEHTECINKAKAVVTAFKMADKGGEKVGIADR
jgi:anthranilate synthase component 1